MTGRPRSAGSSRCSTDAKNASRSAWRTVATADDTNVCSHRCRTARKAPSRPRPRRHSTAEPAPGTSRGVTDPEIRAIPHRLVTEALAHDDATGWFEPLYAAAAEADGAPPWN